MNHLKVYSPRVWLILLVFCVVGLYPMITSAYTSVYTTKIDGIGYKIKRDDDDTSKNLICIVSGADFEVVNANILPEIEWEGVCYPVIAIREYAFNGCTSLSSIVLPEGLQSIGESAFSGCKSLSSIVLPEGLQSIGESAFSGCTSLSSIVLLEGLQSIGDRAFENCTSLSSIVLPEGLQSIGDRAFYNCTSLSSIVLLEGLQSIRGYAFYNCTSLSSIVLPEGLQSIWQSAFENCTSLSFIVLPEGLQSIWEFAFSGCTSLSYVVVPKSLGGIRPEAFQGCHIKDVIIEDGYDIISIGGFPYVETLYLGRQIIATGVFKYLSTLETVTTGNYFMEIPAETFSYCNKLRTVVLGNSIKTIGENAFTGSHSIQEITSWNPVPPSYETGFITPLYESCTLYVPFGALEDYKEAVPWKYFRKIIEKDPAGITDAEIQTIKLNINDAEFSIEGTEETEVLIYAIDGKLVYSGSSRNEIKIPSKGIFMVKAGTASKKILL